MIISNEYVLDYLLHRTGEKQIQKFRKIIQKDIQGNANSPDFLKTFGNSNISAYIGFIDLSNFSSITHGEKPEKIALYLNIFLKKTIDLLNKHGALIDKMIGDEIMFILPEVEENFNTSEIIKMGFILGNLHDLAFELEPNYKFRIGLSYGKVNVFHLKGNNYSEWSIVGEPVHVAKRLHSLKELEKPDPICGAFGLSSNHNNNNGTLQEIQQKTSIMVSLASKFNNQINPKAINLKGVENVYYSIFSPK